MAKRLREHVKYTVKELDHYVQTEGSCVQKVNTNLHLSLGPFCLADFKHVLMAHIVRSKVGFYDVHLEGIVLDVKKVKILGTTGAMRGDDPRIHINVNADVYLFKPREGAELAGVVKHLGAHHVGVVLYRVFNANLRVCHKVDKEEVQMEQTVKFRILNYNLQNVFPYIDGELISSSGDVTTKGKKIGFKDNDNVDSGIEEKEGVLGLDELLSIIKIEQSDGYEKVSPAKKSSKRSKKHSESMESDESGTPSKKSKEKGVHELDDLLAIIKSEETNGSSNRSKKHSELKYGICNVESVEFNDSGTPVEKVKRKRRTISSLTSSHDGDGSECGPPPLTPKKIKKEPEYSGDEEAQQVAIQKVKKEKSSKAKTNSSPAIDLTIKQELDTDDD